MADKKDIEASGSREKVLVAAEAVFAEHGFDGARVDEITTRAGVNVRMLYHHFGSKEGLFQAVGDRFDEAIVDRLGRVFGAESDAELVDLLVRTVEEIWDFLEENPNFVRICGWCDLQHDRLSDMKHPSHDYVRNVLFPRITDLAGRDGWAPGVDPAHVMVLCWSLPFFWQLNREVCRTFSESEDSEAQGDPQDPQDRDRAYRDFIINVVKAGLRGHPAAPAKP